MNASKSNSVAVIGLSYGGFLNWAVEHALDVPELLKRGQAVLDAGTVRDKWEATKSFGDLVVTIYDDLPIGQLFALREGELEAQVVALKLGDGAIFRKIFPLLQQLLPLLVGKLLDGIAASTTQPAEHLASEELEVEAAANEQAESGKGENDTAAVAPPAEIPAETPAAPKAKGKKGK